MGALHVETTSTRVQSIDVQRLKQKYDANAFKFCVHFYLHQYTKANTLFVELSNTAGRCTLKPV